MVFWSKELLQLLGKILSTLFKSSSTPLKYTWLRVYLYHVHTHFIFKVWTTLGDRRHLENSVPPLHVSN